MGTLRGVNTHRVDPVLVGDQHAFQGDLEPRAIAADRKRLGLAEGRDERLHV